MKYKLQFKKKEEVIVFDNLEFFEFHYMEPYDILDAKIKFQSIKQLEQAMSVFQELFIDDEIGGTEAAVVRDGGMTILGRVFIYPMTGREAKIHIDVKN